MKQSVKGSLYLLSATAIWGFSFIAQSVGMENLGPFTFQAFRCSLAVIFLALAILVVELPKKGFVGFLRGWANRRLWLAGLACGAALTVAASLQQIGILYETAGKSGFITAMYIVLVPILGIFFRQKPPKSAWISVFLAVIGLYLLSNMGTPGAFNKGDFFLIACAFGFAIQILVISKVSPGLDPVRLNCIQALVVTIFSIPFIAATERFSFADVLSGWFPLVFAGVFSMGVAYTLQIAGQQRLNPTAASLMMCLESVFAALGGWLFLRETMTIKELFGCTLVLTAVILVQFPDKRT